MAGSPPLLLLLVELLPVRLVMVAVFRGMMLARVWGR